MSEEGIIVLQAQVLQSLLVSTAYKVYIWLEKGRVIDAVYECVTGQGGCCSHVAPLLFLVEGMKSSAASEFEEVVTCTGRPQQWCVPSRKTVTPQRLVDVTFNREEYGKETCGVRGSINFDPRRDEDKTVHREALQQLLNAAPPLCGLLDCSSLKPCSKRGTAEQAKAFIIQCANITLEPYSLQCYQDDVMSQTATDGN